MKNKLLKRLIAIAMAATMAMSLAACGSDSQSSSGSGSSSGTDDSGYTQQADNNDSDIDTETVEDVSTLESDDLSYVLIYNPKMYQDVNGVDENACKTGELGLQIETGFDRADGLEEDKDALPRTPDQSELLEGVDLEGFEPDLDRAESMGFDYKKGAKKTFFYDNYNNGRPSVELQCSYVGENCYIWSDGNVDERYFDYYGKLFDNEIYGPVTEEFGTPCFVGETGKVNILFFEMEEDNTLGYFHPLDGFGGGFFEGTVYENCVNSNHAIININSKYLDYKDVISPTLAHEFQHLIYFTNETQTMNGIKDTLSGKNTWINEGMSGYIEEKLYPGSKEHDGHFSSFNTSELIRNGQSLYNFAINDNDIGVYGSVFYFTEFMRNLSDNNAVLSNYASYLREEYSPTLSAAEGLNFATSSNAQGSISDLIDYNGKIQFESAEHEWLSKATLEFYLNILSKDTQIDSFSKINRQSLLFDDISGGKIEGGGRIIVSVDGGFEIPEDADSGLVYVGLDKDFNKVTDFVIK